MGLFFYRRHTPYLMKKKWNKEFKGELFVSHVQSNSCGVTIDFIGNTRFEVSNKNQDESARILILDVKVGDIDFLLITLYNDNKESEQLNTLSILCNLLDNIFDLHCKNIILGGDFNIFFNLTYKAFGGNPKMKNKSVAKFIHIKESLRLCDIWRVRNPKKKRYTFRQQHVTGFIQRTLDFFLVSNNLQESIKNRSFTHILSIV